MRVVRLKIANFRPVETAELAFQPGFNLIVGVNGVGKTTVLDALSFCLRAVVRESVRRITRGDRFTNDDVRVGADALDIECETQIGDKTYRFLVHKSRATTVAQEKKAGQVREQVHETPDREEFIGDAPKLPKGMGPGGRPFAVLFSTNRAVPTERAPSKGVAGGGIPAAYAEAFSSRELRLVEFASWLRAQQALRREKPSIQRVLDAFEGTVRRFLAGYSNLRVSDDDPPKLLIDHGKTTLSARQLSDGERGTLAMVLDLTRRLAQANPELNDPAAEAEAVVLIDELDLHLHPKWQRQIVRDLTAAFPRCQFIATTHSPQIIGEVSRERILIIEAGQVYSPEQSFGVDSSRILEEIMDTRPRSQSVDDLLAKLARAVADEKLDDARELIAKVEAQVGENDPEVTRARTLMAFLERKS